MTFSPSDTVFVEQGDYRPTSVCFAVIGSHIAPTRWAFEAMHLAFPPGAGRSLMCIVNENLDVARNLAIHDWGGAHGDLRSDWIALVPTGAHMRADAIVLAIQSGAPITRIGEAYVLSRDAIAGTKAPWFVDNAWAGGGGALQDLTADLAHEAFGAPRGQETATEETKRSSERSWSDASQLIAIGIPTLGKVGLPWVVNALRVAMPMTCTATLIAAEGHPVATARQRIVNTVLTMATPPAYLLFWGDDNLPPPDGIRLLLETARTRDAPAVSGLYYMKSFPPAQAVMWRNGHMGPLIAGKDFQTGDILEVDGSGLDFVLFKTEALAALPALKFRTVLDYVADRGLVVQTEDAYFWDRWREVHGKGPLVDTRCRVGHYSMFDGGVY